LKGESLVAGGGTQTPYPGPDLALVQRFTIQKEENEYILGGKGTQLSSNYLAKLQ